MNPANTTPTILIASEDLLSTWSSKPAPADLLTLTDADLDHALAVVSRRRPKVLVLNRAFAASERGVTFVNKLRLNAALTQIEVRVLPDARTDVLRATGPVNGRLIASVARALRCCADIPSSTRRAPRLAAPPDLEVQLDGVRMRVVDVSTFGLQIVSPVAVRPSSSIDLVINHEGIELFAPAEIAWASAEMGGSSVAYRAGIAFDAPRPELLKLTHAERIAS